MRDRYPIYGAYRLGPKGGIGHKIVMQSGTSANREIRGMEQHDTVAQPNDDPQHSEWLRFQLHHVLPEKLERISDRRWVADLNNRDSRQGIGPAKIGS